MTGIITRKREFAVLQSIGMTNRQLRHMLTLEGMLYTLGALLITTILSIVSAPLVGHMLSRVFWFFTYRFTLMPIAVIFPIFLFLGIIVPLISYQIMGRQSIVDRIRQAG